MRPLNVLLTCASLTAKSMIECLKDNGEREIKVYVTNSSDFDLPKTELCDGTFKVPSIYSDDYIECLLNICKTNYIDIIIPCVSLELEFMAKWKNVFEQNGIVVSVSSLDSIKIANDKIKLHGKFKDIMPNQIIPRNYEEADAFLSENDGVACCKVADKCGGKGFAIIDNDKASDVMLFHRFGKKHYINTHILKNIVDRGDKIILQQYIQGIDYTVSALADKGKVIQMLGYVGYIMEFGTIMYGEIKQNKRAYDITERIISELNFDGNIGVDFILKEDGEVKLLEVNPRVNASLSFCKEAGYNLIYDRCKILIGEKPNSPFSMLKDGLKMKKYYENEYFI